MRGLKLGVLDRSGHPIPGARIYLSCQTFADKDCQIPRTNPIIANADDGEISGMIYVKTEEGRQGQAEEELANMDEDEEVAAMCEAAAADERLSDGRLYARAAEVIRRLIRQRDEFEGALSDAESYALDRDTLS